MPMCCRLVYLYQGSLPSPLSISFSCHISPTLSLSCSLVFFSSLCRDQQNSTSTPSSRSALASHASPRYLLKETQEERALHLNVKRPTVLVKRMCFSAYYALLYPQYCTN